MRIHITKKNRDHKHLGLRDLGQRRSIAQEPGRSSSTISLEIHRNQSRTGYWVFSANKKEKTMRVPEGKKTPDEKPKASRLCGRKSEIGMVTKSHWRKVDYRLSSEQDLAHFTRNYYLPIHLCVAAWSVETNADRRIASGKQVSQNTKAEVGDRSVPGHWEGGLILGKYKHTALGTLVDRTTHYTILVPLGERKDTESRIAYFALGTWDKRKHLWIVRQYFPKETDFTQVVGNKIKEVQDLLIDRPRALLNYHKPDEIFKNLVALKL